MSKKLIFIFLVSILILHLSASAEDVTSEVLDIKTENNLVLIEVAKKYPQIKFSGDQNKLLIELLETKYHANFKFDENIKNNLLTNLGFINDVTVGVAKYGGNKEGENEKQKVAVTLTINPDIEIEPKILSTKDNIVKILLSLKDKEDKKKEEPEKTVTELFNEAVNEHKNNHLEKAKELYKEALVNDSDFILASFNLAKLYLDQTNYDNSIELLINLLQKVQSLSLADEEKIKDLNYILNTLGTAYYLKGDLSEAENRFNNAVEINPNSSESYFNLGLIYEQKKDLDKARASFVKALKLKPDCALAHYHLGILDMILKNKNDARVSFEEVVELEPSSTIGILSKKELEEFDRKLFKRRK